MILLFEIFIDDQNGNAIGDLNNILDRVTPLYKHRMDDLAPLKQNIVHTIALNWDAITPDDIARKTRLKMAEVTTLLSELKKVFIVQRVATDIQTHLYYLTERFFNIWYLMRLAPKGSQTKVIWLVRFLEYWYDKNELVQRAQKQIYALGKGDYYPKAAYYLAEALVRTAQLDMETEHELINATRIYLADKDKSLLAELSPSDKELFEKGNKYFYESINKADYQKALDCFSKIKNKGEIIYYRLVYLYDKLGKDEKSKECYKKAIEPAYVGVVNNLGDLYTHKVKNYSKAEEYYLMAVEKTDVNAMNNLAWLYFIQKIKKEEALKYAIQAVEKDKKPFFVHTLSCIYLWHNKIELAIQVEKEFMYIEFYEKYEKDGVVLYLMLLIAKQQYQHAAAYFESPDLDLKDRFKPLYYALLYLTGDKDYAKCPPELAEPVNDIIEKIRQMAMDYA